MPTVQISESKLQMPRENHTSNIENQSIDRSRERGSFLGLLGLLSGLVRVRVVDHAAAAAATFGELVKPIPTKNTSN